MTPSKGTTYKCCTMFQCEVSNCVVFGAVNCIAWVAKQVLLGLTKGTNPVSGYLVLLSLSRSSRLLRRQCAMKFVGLVEGSMRNGEGVGVVAWQVKGGIQCVT